MVTAATAAIIVSAVAVAATTATTIIQTQQQRQAARRNARLQEFAAESQAEADKLAATQEAQNAVLAEQEAGREGEAQAFRERRQRERQRFLAGSIRAEAGAAGLLLEGSPLYVLQENLRQSELGLLTERAASEARQLALRTEAGQRVFQAGILQRQGAERLRLGRFGATITRFEGQQQFTGGVLRAGGTVLGGTGRLLSRPTSQTSTLSRPALLRSSAAVQ